MHGISQLVTAMLFGANIASAVTLPVHDNGKRSTRDKVMSDVKSALAGNLVKRQNGWESKGDGNVKIRMSDKRINFGFRAEGKAGDEDDLLATNVLAHALIDGCSEIACHGDDYEYEDLHIINDWWKTTVTLLVDADGNFPDEGAGQRGDMILVAAVALEMARDEHEAKWSEEYSCRTRGGKDHCEKMAELTDPVTEKWYPEEIHVRVQDDSGSQISTLDVHFSLDSNEEDGLCGMLTTLGGALSSVVGGVPAAAGPGYALASLFCT